MIELGDFSFLGPFPTPSALNNRAGVYAILCSKDGAYTLLDVGESPTVRDRVAGHDRAGCWSHACAETVSYAVYYTPDLEQGARESIERELRSRYELPCGEP